MVPPDHSWNVIPNRRIIGNWGTASPRWIHRGFRGGAKLTPALNELLQPGQEAGNGSKCPLHLKGVVGKGKPGFSMEGKTRIFHGKDSTAAAWRGLPLDVFHGFGQQEWRGDIHPWRWRNLGAEWENSKFPVLGGGRERGPGRLQAYPKILGKHGCKKWEKWCLGSAVSHLPPGKRIKPWKREKGMFWLSWFGFFFWERFPKKFLNSFPFSHSGWDAESSFPLMHMEAPVAQISKIFSGK